MWLGELRRTVSTGQMIPQGNCKAIGSHLVAGVVGSSLSKRAAAIRKVEWVQFCMNVLNLIGELRSQAPSMSIHNARSCQKSNSNALDGPFPSLPFKDSLFVDCPSFSGVMLTPFEGPFRTNNFPQP